MVVPVFVTVIPVKSYVVTHAFGAKLNPYKGTSVVDGEIFPMAGVPVLDKVSCGNAAYVIPMLKVVAVVL